MNIIPGEGWDVGEAKSEEMTLPNGLARALKESRCLWKALMLAGLVRGT